MSTPATQIPLSDLQTHNAEVPANAYSIPELNACIIDDGAGGGALQVSNISGGGGGGDATAANQQTQINQWAENTTGAGDPLRVVRSDGANTISQQSWDDSVMNTAPLNVVSNNAPIVSSDQWKDSVTNTAPLNIVSANLPLATSAQGNAIATNTQLTAAYTKPLTIRLQGFGISPGATQVVTGNAVIGCLQETQTAGVTSNIIDAAVKTTCDNQLYQNVNNWPFANNTMKENLQILQGAQEIYKAMFQASGISSTTIRNTTANNLYVYVVLVS